MVLEALRSRRRAILEAAARHGARNVRVFGSTVRGDAGPSSDVDFLVDIEPGRSLLDVVGLEQDLEELLGRPVEVLTDGGLSPYLQERIIAEAQALGATTAATCNPFATRSLTSPPTRAPVATPSSPNACDRTRRCASWKSSAKPLRISRTKPGRVNLTFRGNRLPACATKSFTTTSA